jgi:NAD(P)H dehydrogenase (quinone)
MTFTFGRDHFHTEEHIRAAPLQWAFLRENPDSYRHLAET